MGMSAPEDGYRFDGLAEFVSYRARVKLVEMLLGKGLSIKEIAAMVGVTTRSVRRWLNRSETHPCNKNLDRMLCLAWQASPSLTFELLRDELCIFAALISDATKNNFQLGDDQR
jgi:transcriptional regulator with XRE-family HTH domain